MNQIVKLSAVPARDSKTGVYAIEVPFAQRLSVLNWKTVEDEATKVKSKRESEAYFVPILHSPLTEASSMADKMQADLINEVQDDYLRDYAEGNIEAAALIVDLEAMATDYFKDGRGNRNGLKQSALVEYVVKTLASYMKARITRNMPTKSDAERMSLVNSLVRQFKIAATRGNQATENKAKVWVSLPALKDLQQRLETYSYVSDDASEETKANALESSEELTCLQARIAKHIKDSSASLEVSNEQF